MFEWNVDQDHKINTELIEPSHSSKLTELRSGRAKPTALDGLAACNAELTKLGENHGTLWKEGIRESRESNA